MVVVEPVLGRVVLVEVLLRPVPRACATHTPRTLVSLCTTDATPKCKLTHACVPKHAHIYTQTPVLHTKDVHSTHNAHTNTRTHTHTHTHTHTLVHAPPLLARGHCASVAACKRRGPSPRHYDCSCAQLLLLPLTAASAPPWPSSCPPPGNLCPPRGNRCIVLREHCRRRAVERRRHNGSDAARA